ncbi:Lipoprotein LipO precursor [compost metagenome]
MELMWVRKDWLDRLGLQVPKTLDDYVAVAKAFAEQDPDGNGKKDTLGLLIGENLNNTTPFFGAFGVQRRQWVERGGQLVYSSTLPEMKQALQFLAGLYKDKIIDQEWALNKSQVVGQKVGSGKAGLYSGLWSARRGEILTNEQNDPNAKWVEAGFPIGKDGKSGTVAGNLVVSYNVVPVTSKNADSVVKMLNFMVGKGYSDLLLGFENQIWTRDKDGKVVTNFEEHNKHVYRNSLTNIVTPSDRASYIVQLKSLGEQFNLVPNIEMINKVLMETKFTGIPTAPMGKYSASLDKLENEYFTKIVLGISPIDTFDEFVAQWTKQGGAEITKDVNDWYKSKK